MKKNFYSVHGNAVDQKGITHVVTVVGELICDHETKHIEWDAEVTLDPDKGKIVPGKISFDKKVLHRQLTLGLAICNPQDEFDEETGIKIAKSRIRRGEDCGSLETNSVTMLTTDCVYALLLNKLKWVCDHIDLYIGENDEEITPTDTLEGTETTLEEDETDEVDNVSEEDSEAVTDEENDDYEDDDVSLFDRLPSFEELQKALDKMNKAIKQAHTYNSDTCSCGKKKGKKCKSKIDKSSEFDKDIEEFIFGY